MNIDFPINWQISELPSVGFSLDNIYKAIANNLTGTVDEVLLPTADPTENIATGEPFFDGSSWFVWHPDELDYKPVRTKIGNVTIEGDPSADRVQNVQAKSGTVALLDDTYKIRDTVYLKEGLVLIDWDKGSKFLCVLSGNRQPAFYMTNSKDGMKINVLVVNNGTKQTIGTWDSSIKWPSGVVPAIPAATAGRAASLIVTIRNINGNIYAESVNQTHDPITDKATASGLISL